MIFCLIIFLISNISYLENETPDVDEIIIEDDNFKYVVVNEENSEVALIGTKTGECPTSVEIPEIVSYEDHNYTVISLQSNGIAKTFEGCYFTSFSFPSTLKIIMKDAFFICNFSSPLDFPESLTTLGMQSFILCMFSTISLPKLVEIGSSVFYYCTFDTINIPSSIKTFGESAFTGCTFLQKFIFPSTLQQLKKGAFLDCNFSNIQLPKQHYEFYSKIIIKI